TALRSQRALLNGRPEYVEAYQEGIRFWKDRCYGPALCSELIDRLGKGRLDAAAILLALIRYRPRGLTGRVHPLMLGKWCEFASGHMVFRNEAPFARWDSPPTSAICGPWPAYSAADWTRIRSRSLLLVVRNRSCAPL